MLYVNGLPSSLDHGLRLSTNSIWNIHGILVLFTEDLKIDQASLVMTATSPTCINLQWQALSGVNSYQVSCTDHNKMNKTSSSISVCGYAPYTRVTCSVISLITQTQINDGYSAVAVNVTSYTNCTDPTKPEFNVIDRVQIHRGAQPDTRNLAIQITSASVPNCASIRNYNIRLYFTGNFSHVATRSTVSHGEDIIFDDVKAVTNYTVTVVAVNNRYKLSNITSKTIRTKELAPEAVANMVLTSASPYCVNMSWNVPPTTNGALLTYKYNCTGQTTTNTDSADITETMICGFTPYQNVTCGLKAVNSYSDGEVVRESTFTLCIKPEEVSDIQVVQGSHDVDGHQRRNVSITWRIGKPNCESISRCHITLIHNVDQNNTIKETEFSPGSQNLSRYTSEFSELTGGQTYTIKFICENNRDMRSETTELQFQADDLPPYDSVSDFQLRSNSSCVNMSWIPPREPNGLITYYKYVCLSTDVSSTGTIQKDDVKSIPNTTKLQYLICKLRSESKYNCTLEAGNQAGLSPTASNSLYTKFNYHEISPPVVEMSSYVKISISFKPVLLHHGSLQPQYYLVIVEELSSLKQSSLVDDMYLYNSAYSRNRNLTYYVAAKLYFDESDDDIYFVCGDGRFYGGYYNAPLSVNKLYKIHYAFAVPLDGIMITQVVKARGPPLLLLTTTTPTTTTPTTTTPTTTTPTTTTPTTTTPTTTTQTTTTLPTTTPTTTTPTTTTLTTTTLTTTTPPTTTPTLTTPTITTPTITTPTITTPTTKLTTQVATTIPNPGVEATTSIMDRHVTTVVRPNPPSQTHPTNTDYLTPVPAINSDVNANTVNPQQTSTTNITADNTTTAEFLPDTAANVTTVMPLPDTPDDVTIIEAITQAAGSVTTVEPLPQATAGATIVKAFSQTKAGATTVEPTPSFTGSTIKELNSALIEVQNSTVAQSPNQQNLWNGVNERKILRELRCPDPPIINNARLLDAGRRRFKNTVSYHCEDGYTALEETKQYAVLTCGKSEDFIELEWTGDFLQCLPSKISRSSKSNQKEDSLNANNNTLLITVCVLSGVLVVTIGLVAVCRFRRNRNRNQTNLANQSRDITPCVTEFTNNKAEACGENEYSVIPNLRETPSTSTSMSPDPQNAVSHSGSDKSLLVGDEAVSLDNAKTTPV